MLHNVAGIFDGLTVLHGILNVLQYILIVQVVSVLLTLLSISAQLYSSKKWKKRIRNCDYVLQLIANTFYLIFGVYVIWYPTSFICALYGHTGQHDVIALGQGFIYVYYQQNNNKRIL